MPEGSLNVEDQAGLPVVVLVVGNLIKDFVAYPWPFLFILMYDKRSCSKSTVAVQFGVEKVVDVVNDQRGEMMRIIRSGMGS